MRIALSSQVRKRTFLVTGAALLSAAWLLCLQTVVERGLQLSGTVKNLQRACRIQPLNAETEGQLGAALMDAPYYDDAAAVPHLQRSVALNPHYSHEWLTLADAYQVTDDNARRDDAVRHALAAEPNDGDVQWQAANLFINSDLDGSLRLLQGVIENQPAYATAAMEVAYRASRGDVERTMLAVPLTTSSRLQLIRWLLDHGQNESADRVWPTVLTAKGNLVARDVFFYLDSLVARRQVTQAATVWSGLLQKDDSLRARTAPGNLVINGDFESELLNGGFGWRYVPTTGVTASLDTSSFRSGTRSLSMQIDADNLMDCGLSELVPAEPGARYHISVWMHAEELEAAHGVRLAASDAYSHADLLLTDEAIGSFPWRQLEGEFTVPADTQLIRLALVRSPANGLIRGRLWVDDVRIEKQ